MDTIIFGTFTLKHLLIAAGAVIVLYILFHTVKDLFMKKSSNQHIQSVECRSCGWQGQVSRLTGRCPVCNTPLGDRRI